MTHPSHTLQQRRAAGFTLIEITVAVLVMAILAIISFRGMSAMLDARDQLTEHSQRWYHLSVFFSQLESDLLQLKERKFRDRDGAIRPGFIGKPDFIRTSEKTDEDAQIMFIRAGIADQVGFAADMKRIGYRYRNGKIEMLLWPALDLAPETYPTVETVLENVRGMEIRYLNTRGKWAEYWPDTRDISPLPRGLEITVTLSSGERIRRLFALNQGVAH